MYTVIKEIEFSYAHRLLNYEGKCARLHGHNGRIQIEMASAELDECSMVVDFHEIKEKMAAWVDDMLDHQLILCEKDPLVEVLREQDEPFVVIEENPTAEVMAKMIFEEASRQGFPVTKVTLFETCTSAASYSE